MQRHCLCIQKMLIPFEQSTHCDQLARFYCGRYQHSKYQCLLPFYLPVHDQRQQRSRWQKQNTIQCSFRKSGCLFRMEKQKYLQVTHNSTIGKALAYSISQEEYLRVFLSDGNVPMDNRYVEQAIRPFTIGRKNFVMINLLMVQRQVPSCTVWSKQQMQT